MDEHFLAVAKATGAEWGEWDFYSGVLDCAPFLLRQTATEPPGCYFKFRKKGKTGRPAPISRPTPIARPTSVAGGPLPVAPAPVAPTTWHDRLSEDCAKAGVSCEMDEDEYVFLWIGKPHLLTPESIASLARECVREHAYLLPDQDRLCLTCGSTGEADLHHSEASVTSICPRCLDKKLENHSETLEKLNRPSAMLPLLYPAALFGGSLVWAIFWSLWDAMFRMLNTNEVIIPRLVIIALAAGIGFCAGWPIGTVLRRSGPISRFSASVSSIFATLTIVLIGELLYGVGLAYYLTQPFDLGLTLRATLLFTVSSSPGYALIKFLFACALAIAAYEVSKPKTKKLRL